MILKELKSKEDVENEFKFLSYFLLFKISAVEITHFS